MEWIRSIVVVLISVLTSYFLWGRKTKELNERLIKEKKKSLLTKRKLN